jgi:hypothetical protein
MNYYKKKSVIYSFLSLVNIAFWIGIVASTINTLYITFSYLTVITFTITTFYFSTHFGYNLKYFILEKQQKLTDEHEQDRFYLFMRDRFSKYSFCASTTICILYWCLMLGGDSLMYMDNDSTPLYVNLYVHFLIGV